MTTILRASTLSAIATFLAFGSPAGSFDDGRGDWNGYSWQTIPIASCLTAGDQLACPPYHQRWDWKRNQWVDIAVAIDTAAGKLQLSQTLTDNDKNDRDHVCVTALVVDADGRNIVGHHQNWHMSPGEVRRDDFTYTSARLAEAAAIQIGSKQCREGANQDDAIYASVLAGIKP